MRPSLLPALTGLSLLGLAVPASAQNGPPGACQCAAPQGYAPVTYAAPSYAPAGYYVAAPEVEPWQAHRFGLGLRLGGTSLTVEGTAESEEFSTVGLAVRYRPSRRWEFEFAIDHGQEDDGEGPVSPESLSAGTLSALLHLRPQSRWDWYLLAGVGLTERRSQEGWTTDGRPHVALGVGLERRFDRLVLGAELRALAQPETTEEVNIANGTAARVQAPSFSEEPMGPGGAQFTLNATWYL